MLFAKCQMLIAKCQMLIAKCQMLIAKCQMLILMQAIAGSELAEGGGGGRVYGAMGLSSKSCIQLVNKNIHHPYIL